jgi:hypothetical protein
MGRDKKLATSKLIDYARPPGGAKSLFTKGQSGSQFLELPLKQHGTRNAGMLILRLHAASQTPDLQAGV